MDGGELATHPPPVRYALRVTVHRACWPRQPRSPSWSAGNEEKLPVSNGIRGSLEDAACLSTPRLEPGPLVSRTVSLRCPASLRVAGVGALGVSRASLGFALTLLLPSMTETQPHPGCHLACMSAVCVKRQHRARHVARPTLELGRPNLPLSPFFRMAPSFTGISLSARRCVLWHNTPLGAGHPNHAAASCPSAQPPFTRLPHLVPAGGALRWR